MSTADTPFLSANNYDETAFTTFTDNMLKYVATCHVICCLHVLHQMLPFSMIVRHT